MRRQSARVKKSRSGIRYELVGRHGRLREQRKVESVTKLTSHKDISEEVAFFSKSDPYAFAFIAKKNITTKNITTVVNRLIVNSLSCSSPSQNSFMDPISEFSRCTSVFSHTVVDLSAPPATRSNPPCSSDS